MQSANGWLKVAPIQAPIARRLSCNNDHSRSLRQMAPPTVPGTLTGAIVALGKFDALHIGHRALAEQASRMEGFPILLSFTGMGEILGWERRLPLVAPCDRARVMDLWGPHCGGQVPGEYSIEFGKIRHLSPEDFVEKLAAELQVKGVVAGKNYRFGYRAAGDASDLERLCRKRGMDVFVVEPVMDKFDKDSCILGGDSKDRGQVSSTRVRKALAEGNMKRVEELLGRSHRLVMDIDNGTSSWTQGEFSVPISKALNQAPAQGCYQHAVAKFLDEGQPVNGSATGDDESHEVVITANEIVVRGKVKQQQQGYLSIEFSS